MLYIQNLSYDIPSLPVHTHLIDHYVAIWGALGSISKQSFTVAVPQEFFYYYKKTLERFIRFTLQKFMAAAEFNHKGERERGIWSKKELSKRSDILGGSDPTLCWSGVNDDALVLLQNNTPKWKA